MFPTRHFSHILVIHRMILQHLPSCMQYNCTLSLLCTLKLHASFELMFLFQTSTYDAHHRAKLSKDLLSVFSVSLNIRHKLPKEKSVLSMFRRELFLSDRNKSHTCIYFCFQMSRYFSKKEQQESCFLKKN